MSADPGYALKHNNMIRSRILEMKKYCAIKEHPADSMGDILRETGETLVYAISLMCKKEYTRGWEHSRNRWAMLNSDRTEEQIYNSEMAAQMFYDACCDTLGHFSSRQEITEALRGGRIHAWAVMTALENGADCFSPEDLSSIEEGYTPGDLGSKAFKELLDILQLA
ncbi:Uncharacterised protein [uncultured archaeon]|nr:Uncharacterised protein [uncultured archaeon]